MQNNDTTSQMTISGFLITIYKQVLDKLKIFLSVFQTWKDRKRTRNYLSEMSPYMLKDIGISESERQAELGKKFWQ